MRRGAEGVSVEETWAGNVVFLISGLGFTPQKGALRV